MLGQAIGAGVGLVGGMLNAYEQSKRQLEQKRIEEDYTRRAGAQLLRAAESNANLNPAATAQRSRQDINATMGSAQGAALNAAAGQMATSGDFSNAAARSGAMSQASLAATAPYAQQLAATNQAQYQGQADKVRQAQSIADSTGQLSNQINYIEQEKANINPLGSALLAGLAGATGGGNSMSSLLKLFDTADSKPEVQDNVVQQNGFVGPPTKPAEAEPAITKVAPVQSLQRQQQAAATPISRQPIGAPAPAQPYMPFAMASSLVQPWLQQQQGLSTLTRKPTNPYRNSY